jgi:hypothetical protein
MNKFYTFNLKENQFLNAEISDEELLKKSEEGMKIYSRPSHQVIEFLLNYSKALEVKQRQMYLLD